MIIRQSREAASSVPARPSEAPCVAILTVTALGDKDQGEGKPPAPPEAPLRGCERFRGGGTADAPHPPPVLSPTPIPAGQWEEKF